MGKHHRRGKPGSYVDPVGVIARGIVNADRLGHADTTDFVMVGVRALDLSFDRSDEVVQDIADELFEDSGQQYATEQQMAAFIHARLLAAITV